MSFLCLIVGPRKLISLSRCSRQSDGSGRKDTLMANQPMTDLYADEVVTSSYAYPKGYAVKPLIEQINTLSRAFNLDPNPAEAYVYANAYSIANPPEGAEGWFAVVRSEALAEEHGQAIEKVLAVIEARRPFHNYRKEQLTPAHVRRSARTAEAMKTFYQGQEGDILILPAQLGMRHRGKSVRLAIETFQRSEFGLDSVSVGSIAITHPERFQRFDELDTDCAGDEYSPGAGGDFSKTLCFDFDFGRLEFDGGRTDFASKDCGAASGFLVG